MATFSSELVKRGHRPWISVEIAGYGRRLGATAAADSYRWAIGRVAGASDDSLVTDRVIPGLLDVPDSLSESIDVKSGTTDLGQIEFGLLLAAPLASVGHGWIDRHPTLDMLAVRSPVASWHLSLGTNAISTTLHISTSAAPPVVGQALWIGQETVIVTGVTNPDPLVADSVWLDVIRGCYGSTATPHPAWGSTAPGDGLIYDRPTTLRGRRVTLRLTFADPCRDAVNGLPVILPLSEEVVLFSGTIDDYQLPSATTVTITATSILGMLDRSIGRQQWTGIIRAMSAYDRYPDPELLRNLTLPTLIDGDATQIVPDYPAVAEGVAPDILYRRRFYARVKDQICLFNHVSDSATDGHGTVIIEKFGCLGTDPTSYDVSETAISDVLLTHPAPGRYYADGEDPLSFFTLDGEATSHPIDIMLALITSTGTGQNWDWDILPAHWGAAIPYTLVDLASFRMLKDQTVGLSFPQMVIGWESKPEPLRAMLETEILGPMGWFLFQDRLGRISISRLADAYPGIEYPLLGEVDIIAGSISIDGGLQDTVTAQSWEYQYDWATGEYSRHKKYIPATADALDGDDSELSWSVKGVAGGLGGAETLISQRSRQIAYWFASPLPRIKLSVQLDLLLDVDLGGLVILDGLRWPTLLAPSASAWGQVICLVVERAVHLRGQPRLELALIPLPDGRTGRWAPSGTVTGWVPLTRTLTLGQHDFGGTSDPVDAARFLPGDQVILIGSRGVPISDSAMTVASQVGDTVTLVEYPQSGEADYEPQAGDTLVYARWHGSTAPAGTWTSTMRAHVAMASLATGLMPDGSTEPYVYGG